MPAISPTRTDAILAAATFCLVAVAVATDGAAAARAVLAYCFALGFAVLVLCCRRWPVAVPAVAALAVLGYYVLELPPVGLTAPTAAVLYVAAERGRAAPAAAVGGGLLAVSVLARLAEGDDPSVVVGLELGSEAVAMVAVIALGDAVRSRRSLRAEMARQADAAAEERRREAARQVEAERLRIAREVHDTLGHTMSVISLQSAAGEEALADGRPESAGAALAAIRSASGSAMAELRATLGTLRRDHATREPAEGFDRLPALVEGVRRSGLPVAWEVTGDAGRVPAVVGTTVYRVVQEALTNVLRHARASSASVTVQVAADRVTLEVADDGRGAGDARATGDARVTGDARESGHGLRGMSERVALLGGTVEAGNAESGGFRVRASLPLSGGEG